MTTSSFFHNNMSELIELEHLGSQREQPKVSEEKSHHFGLPLLIQLYASAFISAKP